MRRGGSRILVVALGLVLLLGVAALYRLRISRGDVFPEYSSLRADPLGTRALHDAAALLPDREAVRWPRALDRLQAGTADLVFVAGLKEGDLAENDWPELDRLVRGGARVVVAWRAVMATERDEGRAREIRENPWRDRIVPEPDGGDEEPAEESEAKPTEARKDDALEPKGGRLSMPIYAADHEQRWGFRLMRRDLGNRAAPEGAQIGAAAPSDWPASLSRWGSDWFFLPRDDAGWRVLYLRDGEPVMMERTRGAGSIVLMADSFPLSNEAVQRARATPVLTTLLGDAGRVIFAEAHLGVTAETGIAVLARRYGLTGAALAALALAALWIWRRASPLAPILPEDEEVRLRVAPTAGLEALLRRAVPPAKLFAACLEAWRSGASAGDRRRLQASPAPSADDPATAYNATTRALSHRKLS